MDPSDPQFIPFPFPKSLVRLHISGTSRYEEENDERVDDPIEVADLVKAIKPLPVLAHVEIDRTRFRLDESCFEVARVFAQSTTIRILTIFGFSKPCHPKQVQERLSHEFGQRFDALSWQSEWELRINWDIIRKYWMTQIYAWPDMGSLSEGYDDTDSEEEEMYELGPVQVYPDLGSRCGI